MSVSRPVAVKFANVRISGRKAPEGPSRIPVPVRTLTSLPPRTAGGKMSGRLSGIPVPARALSVLPSSEGSSAGKSRKSSVAFRAPPTKSAMGAASAAPKATVSPPARPSPFNKGKGKAVGVAARRSANRASSVQAARGTVETSEVKPKGILCNRLRYSGRKASTLSASSICSGPD
jgi:hypothetical protein